MLMRRFVAFAAFATAIIVSAAASATELTWLGS
jgi:hypothetical protein